MGKITYRLNDDWQESVVDEVYAWLMDAWDVLKSKYDMEMKNYSWQGLEKGWRDPNGHSDYSIIHKYPSSISCPLGRISYSCSAWSRAYDATIKIHDKIGDRPGVCMVDDDNVLFDLDDGGVAHHQEVSCWTIQASTHPDGNREGVVTLLPGYSRCTPSMVIM